MLSEKSKGWLCLLAAGLLEIVWAYFFKKILRLFSACAQYNRFSLPFFKLFPLR